jgi:hypothetical protein
MLPFQPGKSGPLLLPAVIIILTMVAAACASPLPSPGPADIDQPQPSTGAAQAPALEPEPVKPIPSAVPTPTPPVQIKLVHHRGTLTRIGCCNQGLYERDEFVVIQNVGESSQDITGWQLTNITKGYPTFTFPSHFPCLPYDLPTLEDTEEQAIVESYYTLTKNPAQSEANRFSKDSQQSKPVNVPNSDVSWSSCTPLEPLDETPMKPVGSQQGVPLPCILYPGQTILVFTDEVHCQTGGFSFNWGQGNIWNNEIADTAVLYNAAGEEVSHRSYLVGR